MACYLGRMRLLPNRLSSALVALLGCGEQLPPVDTSPTEGGCAYPVGAVDPMAEGEVLYPYRWPVAKHRDGRDGAVDLATVPCNTDPDIDWSPFDVLLFVSIPAW